jgi:phosphatidylethanolamine/phosphatidyl-N-methylethanolamine N-methyltransferase
MALIRLLREKGVATEAGVFFALWLQKPLRIAATNPSSQRVADAIAAQVDLSRSGPVLELGAGTGSLTRGLLRAGCPPDRIIAVEREPDLAAILRRNFPRVMVIEADATRLAKHPALAGVRLCAVVSSLPIIWFSAAQQGAVVRPCLDLLGAGGRFIQLTNAFSSPLAMRALGLAGTEVARVWMNLPPVQIWCYWDAAVRPGGAR